MDSAEDRGADRAPDSAAVPEEEALELADRAAEGGVEEAVEVAAEGDEAEISRTAAVLITASSPVSVTADGSSRPTPGRFSSPCKTRR